MKNESPENLKSLFEVLKLATPFDIAAHSIFLGYRGSIAHGTYIPNENPYSIDDRDIIGIAIPPPGYFFSLRSFEQYESMQDKWDIVVYDFIKFIRLLTKANPNTLQVLWTSSEFVLKGTWHYDLLHKNRYLFANKTIYKSFCGYSSDQLHKMEHTSYNGYMGQKRKQLVDKFGFDCKNAQHLIRLLRQGIEFLRTGELLVERPDKDELIEIKTGKWSIQKIKSEAQKLFKEMEQAHKESSLPEKPDVAAIDKLVYSILTQHYSKLI
ncbi:MAG: nucleotidyltransferase domain-containing protein [Bacteroidota bacterium]|nr:nucleotidyltransferase domain-containing protein [Bacteroidota bacterium]